MTIWERISAALSPLGLPLAANSMLFPSGAQLPDTYMVYQVISDPGQVWAGDVEKARTYRVQVTVYIRSGLLNLPNVEGVMIGAGFTRGPGRELPYNSGTGHYSFATDYFFLEDR